MLRAIPWQGHNLVLLSGSVILLATPAVSLDDSALYNLEGADPANAVLFPWVVQCFGVCVFFLLTHYELPLPYAAVMFLVGTTMGVVAVVQAQSADTTESLDQLSTSILQWSNIPSSVLLLVFLPGLIFRDAIEVNFSLFTASLFQILILAFPMALVGTFSTALVAVHLLPYNWPFSLAATFGAVLASTDPIAVGSVLKSAGAPARLQMHITGESMLNDGAAFVFFTIFSQQYLFSLGVVDDSVDLWQGLIIFCRMSLGGTAVGVAFAIALLLILYELDRRLEPEYDVLQVVAALTIAYASYYVSEQVCTMSGVIACVVCGVVARGVGRGLINDNQMMDSYLSLMEHLLSTLLFSLGGVVWAKVLGGGANKIVQFRDVGYLLLVYVSITVIRFGQVGLFYPMFSRLGLHSDWKESVFLSHAGFRGAVGVALALSLNRAVREVVDDPEKLKATETLEFLAGGITLMTLFINGTTAGPVLRLLGLVQPSTSRKQTLRLFHLSSKSFLVEKYRTLVRQRRFARIDFRIIQKHVPFVIEPQQELTTCHRGTSQSVTSQVEEVEDSAAATSFHTSRLIYATSERCSDMVLLEIRQLFAALLSEAYRLEESHCELDARNENGYTGDPVHQRVAFSFTSADQLQKATDDWELIESTKLSENAGSYTLRKLKQLISRKPTSQSCSFRFHQRRLVVIRATAFIACHRRAARKLRDFIESVWDSSLDDDDANNLLEDGTDTVLEESAKQVAEAQAVLACHSAAFVDSAVSHLAAIRLLRELAVFVENSARDGILTKKEAANLLQNLDRNIQETHSCNCHCVVNRLSRDEDRKLENTSLTISEP